MRFKPRVWFPISAVLGVVNVAAVWFAAAAAEPWHATIHGALAAAFGVWATRLWLGRPAPELRDLAPGVEPLALEVDDLRRELAETQDRLDFAERILAQERDPRRMGREPT